MTTSAAPVQPSFGGPPQVLKTATLRSTLTAAARRADLRDVDATELRFTPHDMRRVFATEIVNGGLPLHVAQKLLVHLDLNTTQSYAHEARSMKWLGEVSALEESLRHIRAKQTQVARADRESKARDVAQ